VARVPSKAEYDSHQTLFQHFARDQSSVTGIAYRLIAALIAALFNTIATAV